MSKQQRAEGYVLISFGFGSFNLTRPRFPASISWVARSNATGTNCGPRHHFAEQKTTTFRNHH
jgi:hypothetical protein